MKTNLTIALLLLMMVSCVQDPEFYREGDGDEINATFGSDGVERGVVRVKLKEEPTPGLLHVTDGRLRSESVSIDEVVSALGATGYESVFTIGGRFEKRQREWGLHLWYDILFDETVPVTRAVADFSVLDELEVVEPVYKIKRTDDLPVKNLYLTQPTISSNLVRSEEMPFDDPMLSRQWHYNNTGSLNRSRAGADINLFRAWRVTAGHPDVIVSIVDGGVEYDHPDLAGNMWVNPNPVNGDTHGWNFVDNSPNLTAHFHGTHVAGTVSAVNNNGIGVCGVAGGTGNNDGVKLMSCQIFTNSNSAGRQRTGDAIVYGADNGAVISQNSWGYDITTGYTTVMPTSIKDAVDYFVANAGMDENGNQEGPMAGGVVFFSAGNDQVTVAQYPAAYEKIVAVAAMASDYVKASYSDYGEWVNITAPGGDMNSPYSSANGVYSTYPGSTYHYASGTSMSCPHASGVAALIVSHYGVGKPGFTADDLLEILYSSTREIDSYNPSLRGKLGVGCIDAAMALMPDKGIVPDDPSDLTGQFREGGIELSWKVPADQYGLEAPEFRIYWSENPLDGLDPLSLTEDVSVVSVGNAAPVGEYANFTVDYILENREYYLAVEALDMYDNRSKLVFTQVRTFTTPPKVATPLEDQYFTGKGTAFTKTIDLSEYFTDDDPGDVLTFNAVSAEATVLTVNMEGPVLTMVPQGFGSTVVTVTARDSYGLSVVTTFATMCRDSSQEVDLYPNPAVDHLNIRMGEDVNGIAAVKVINSAGRTVKESQVVISPFQPGKLIVSDLSGGTYTLELKYGKYDLKRTFIKR